MLILFCSDLSLELPFTLTHPKPPESPASSRPPSAAPPADSDAPPDYDAVTGNRVPVDTNLIQLDTELVSVWTQDFELIITVCLQAVSALRLIVTICSGFQWLTFRWVRSYLSK